VGYSVSRGRNKQQEGVLMEIGGALNPVLKGNVIKSDKKA